MTEADYFESRLNDQIEWYGKKSKENQRMYKSLVITELVLSVTIPFLAAYSQDNIFFQIAIGIMGITIAIIAGVMSLNKYQENWTNYRSTAETLKQEKYMYLSKSGAYKKEYAPETPYNKLVSRIEGVISKENKDWQLSTNKPAKDTTGKPTD